MTKFKTGDIVLVGYVADSCLHCENRAKGMEQACLNVGPTWVYDSKERVRADGSITLKPEGDLTYGGYSNFIVIQENFVFALPSNLDQARSCSLMCAGITMYFPLKHFKIGKGHKVGIARYCCFGSR